MKYPAFCKKTVCSFLAATALLTACSSEPSAKTDDAAVSDDTLVSDTTDTPDLFPDTADPAVIQENEAGADNDKADQTDEAVETMPDADTTAFIIPQETACAPSEDTCEAKAVDKAVYASYRKDFYYENYQEGDVTSPIPAPKTGGRMHITGIAAKGGRITAVKLNGQNVADLLTAQKLDWYQAYPLTLTEGEAFWVAFHSRDAAWDKTSNGTLTVETAAGKAFEGSYTYAINQAPLKFVTFTDNYKTLIIHVEPRVQGAATLEKILFNGLDVTASACIPSTALTGGVNHLISLPLCQAVKPGDPWTVTVFFKGLPPSTAGGRVIRDFYPVEAWQNDAECTYPMYNTASYEEHRKHGFDTFFTRPDIPTNACSSYNQPTTIFDLVGSEAEEHGYQTVVTFEHETHYLNYTNVSHIATAFHADECDNELLLNNYPKPETRAQFARKTWELWPDLPTYIGGSRLRYNGAYAGATDIQGFDFYVAACAPHMTVAGTHPPLRAAFDMLFGVHENHMPLTTWAYTQALHNGSWNATIPGVGTKVYRQPTPAEFRIQALSVLMVASKGIMYFQTDKEMREKFPATWEEIGNVNRDIHGLKPYLREGDIHRIIQKEGEFIASVIRSRTMMALILFSLKTSKEPTETQCLSAQNVHWEWAAYSAAVTVDVPADMPVAEILELRNGQFTPVNYTINGRNITFPAIPLDQQNAGRIILMLSDSAIKEDMQQRMNY